MIPFRRMLAEALSQHPPVRAADVSRTAIELGAALLWGSR